jgi:hypothetical protein
MGINKADLAEEHEAFVAYDLKQLMFRWDGRTRQVFRTFHGEEEHPLPVDHGNMLFNDSLGFGERIEAEDYRRGKSRAYQESRG